MKMAETTRVSVGACRVGLAVSRSAMIRDLNKTLLLRSMPT